MPLRLSAALLVLLSCARTVDQTRIDRRHHSDQNLGGAGGGTPPAEDASGPADTDGSASDSGGGGPPEGGPRAPDASDDLLALAEERCSGAPPTCGGALLQNLTLSEANVTGLGTDAVLSAGDVASIRVRLTNTGTSPSDHCVALIATDPNLVLSSQNAEGVAWACRFGDLEPDSSVVFTWQVRPSENATPGLVRFLAYVTQGQSDCPCSQSPRLTFEIELG